MGPLSLEWSAYRASESCGTLVPAVGYCGGPTARHALSERHRAPRRGGARQACAGDLVRRGDAHAPSDVRTPRDDSGCARGTGIVPCWCRARHTSLRTCASGRAVRTPLGCAWGLTSPRRASRPRRGEATCVCIAVDTPTPRWWHNRPDSSQHEVNGPRRWVRRSGGRQRWLSHFRAQRYQSRRRVRYAGGAGPAEG